MLIKGEIVIDTLKKNFMFFLYVLGFPVLLFIWLTYQNINSMTFNIIFLSFHIILSSYLIRKLVKYEDHVTHNYEDKLLHKENELKALFDNNHAYLWTIDLEKKTFISSSGFEEVFGYSRENFLLNYELWLERVIPEDYPIAKEHYDTLKSGQPSNKTWRFKNSDGEIRWLDAWGKPILTNNQVTHITGVAYDVTERKKLERKLKYDASHDYLTGLPNRTGLTNYIEKKLIKAGDTPLSFAVLFLDLDGFKLVNDNYGHAIGDQVLIQAGRRIKDSIGAEAIVTRHGGDEFVLVLPYKDHDTLVHLTTKILNLFESPFEIDGSQIITASIGISIYPKDGDNLPTLIAEADQALYHAKSIGKNSYQFARPIDNDIKLRKNKIEHDLMFATSNNQLEVWYQPKVVLKTNVIYGVEALLRWNHPELGMIPPDEFIPLAESKGAIHDIGLWVFEEVMQQLKIWNKKYFDLTCAINVSNLQFANPRFLDKIQQMLITYEINPEKMTIEITESSMHNVITNQSIKKLKELGFEISIDDFGTGYSALSILSKQLVDEIKIDKAFIRNLTGENANHQIVKTILSLSDTFLSKTVAEGIETEEEALILKELGCLYGQGYLYSRPVKANIIDQLVFRRHYY